MKQALHIMWNHHVIIGKDRTALAMMLLLPLIMSFVTGIALPDGSNQDQSYTVPVAIAADDGGPVTKSLITVLSSSPYDPRLVEVAMARQQVRDKEVSTAVLLPVGIERNLQTGTATEIVVLRSNHGEPTRVVEQQLNGKLVGIRASAAAANLMSAAGLSWTEAYALADEQWQVRTPITVKTHAVTVERTSVFRGYKQASPGYVLMFGMMSMIASGAAVLLKERDEGTLARLMATSVTKGELMLGKTLGILTTGVLQMLLLITMGQLLFRVNWGQSPVALIMLVLALGFAATGIGMLLAALCRTSSQANAVGVLVVLVLSMLGGTWWPLELMPKTMQIVAKCIPSGWAMDGFTSIILRGASPADLLVHTLVLAAFGIVSLGAGARMFRYH